MNLLNKLVCFFSGHDWNDWFTSDEGKLGIKNYRGKRYPIIIMIAKRECLRCPKTEVKEIERRNGR
jgi:hypothetical protein